MSSLDLEIYCDADAYSSEDDNTTNDCSVCDTYEQEGKLDFYDSIISPSAVVHQACSECDAFKVDESQLCDFCIHIHPAHLMTCRCVLDLYDERVFQPEYGIVMGTLSQLESREKGCALCRWCLTVVQADARLFQYTIDKETTISIKREIRVERQRIEYDARWEAHTWINVQPKTSNFAAVGGGEERIYLVHGKRFGKASNLPDNGISINSGCDFSSVLATVVDWAAVSRWKSDCEQGHKSCGETAAGVLPSHFRLIDVAKKRIIDANNDPSSFFALSYVWGTASENEMALCRRNLDELQQPGSLHNLPRTIADAMRVCQQLGQGYLWVDRLCIVQDDKEDKYGQIRSLEAIYSRADLVIIAACGDNMRSALAGVDDKSPRERYQFTTDVFGFTIANRLRQIDYALRSKWAERGWTYQEAVLARRKLYFTPAELWFECAEGYERSNTLSAEFIGGRGNRLTDFAGREFRDYAHHLRQYSKRFLTYPSDIYNAFHGIEDAFYAGSEIIFGLPEPDFSRALRWYPDDQPGLQERRSCNPDVVLPSWSWVSVMGGVQIWDISHHYSTFWDYYPLCNWAILDGTDQKTIRPINSIRGGMGWEGLDEERAAIICPEFRSHPALLRQFLAPAWTKGCIEVDVPADLSRPGLDPIQLQHSSVISAQDLTVRWPTIQEFETEARHEKDSRQDYAVPFSLGKGQIFTRTQSSIMRIEYKRTPMRFWVNTRFLIHQARSHGDGGEIIGSIPNAAECQLRGTVEPGQVTDVDFIALALESMPDRIKLDVSEEVPDKNYLNKRPSADSPSDDQIGVIVMAVRWTGPVARRIGLGWVTLQGWVDSKPEFRTVILA